MTHVTHIIRKIHKESQNTAKAEVNIAEEIIRRFSDMTKRTVYKSIEDGFLKVNGKVTREKFIWISNFDLIEFGGEKFKVRRKPENQLDLFVTAILKENLKTTSIDNLSLSQRIKFSAYILEYFDSSHFQWEQIENSQFGNTILDILKEFYKNNLINHSDKKIPEGKSLIDKLLFVREELYRQFYKIINSIENNLYDNEYSYLFREYRSMESNGLFPLLVESLTENDINYFNLLRKIVATYKSVESENDPVIKIKLCIDATKDYDEIVHAFLGEDKFSIGFKKIAEIFKEKTNLIAGVKDNEVADLFINPENRSYNFESGEIMVHGYILNRGKGIAKNVTLIGTNNKIVEIPQHLVSEIIIPDSSYKIKFPIKIKSNTQLKSIVLNLRLIWFNENDIRNESEILEISIESQQSNLPWEKVKSTSPYDLKKIDDPSKLYGRDKLIEEFKFSIEKSTSLGSFVIHGQKRVGKSSIVKTLESIYVKDKNVHFLYTEVTERKGNDAMHTFNEIGKHLAKQLIRDFERKNPAFINRIQLPSFNGSLSPLIDIIDDIYTYNNEVKIIISIDEFDELNDEFFENSNIGNVFASNIGKGLVSRRFVGVILIGSENTESKTKQGMRLLNAIKFMPVGSFSRSEFEDYCKIIKTPTEDCLVFSPEVLDFLFEYSNGNPFYTNLICDKVFNHAYDKRISYIDQEFLQPILDDIQNTLSSKDFIHFWEDGAADDSFTNKKTFSRRSRILIAYAEIKKEGGVINWSTIRKKIKRPQSGLDISDNQFEETFNEFIKRKIFFVSSDNTIQLKPKLFEFWLGGNGIYQIASQLEDKEGIIDLIQQDEKLKISDEELISIYNIIFDDINRDAFKLFKEFFDQFENNKDRALIADLLKQIKVLRSADLISFLKQINYQIWPLVSLKGNELNYRKDAEIVCLNDSYNQNKSFYENIIIKQFHLHPSRRLKTREELNKLDDEIKHIIIFEPLIDCQFYYRNEISKIVKSINPALVDRLHIHIVSFIISSEAKEELDNLFLKNFNYEYSILSYKEYAKNEIAIYNNKLGGVNDPTIKCLTKIFGEISENSCLVKIGEIIPYQCFPFLWCTTSKFKPLSISQSKLEDYRNRMTLSDELKNYSIRSESKEIELKATMSTPGINWKTIKELSKKLKGDLSKIDPELIKSKKDEISKLWKLEFNQAEKKDIINGVKYSFAKNLSAFANSNGGDIFIGIEDDFTILGVKEGNSEEEIRMLFTEIVKKYIGVEYVDYFELVFIFFSKSDRILRIRVMQCRKDIWIKCDERGNNIDVGNRIYIRTEFGTEKLTTKAYKDWREQRDLKFQISN